MTFALTSIFDKKITQTTNNQNIGGLVNRASATETVNSGSIPGQAKPRKIKIGIQSSFA